MYGAQAIEVYELMHQARGKDYRVEAEEVASQVRAHRPGADSLLDVACGTGGHLRAFRDIFGHVEGLDRSEPMIAAAQDRLPGVPLHIGDMRDFRLGRTFDVITCMFGSIGYAGTLEDLKTVLRCFAHHLRPGGVVAIDPWWFPETFADGYVSAGTAQRASRAVSRVSHSRREGGTSQMEVHYTVADAGSGVRHFSETHVISLFSRAQYEAAFISSGLVVEYLDRFPAGRGLFVGASPDIRSIS